MCQTGSIWIRNGSKGAHPTLCALCAKSTRFCDPFSPMAKVAAVTTVFPCAGLLTFLRSPKPGKCVETDYVSHQKCQIAVQMCCCCPVDVAPRVVGGVRGGRGKADLPLGVVPALCAGCAERPPNTSLRGLGHVCSPTPLKSRFTGSRGFTSTRSQPSPCLHTSRPQRGCTCYLPWRRFCKGVQEVVLSRVEECAHAPHVRVVHVRIRAREFGQS